MSRRWAAVGVWWFVAAYPDYSEGSVLCDLEDYFRDQEGLLDQ